MSVILSDAFAGTNGADVDGRALDVGGVMWVVTDGAFDIQGNKAHCDSVNVPGREATVLAESGLSDGTISQTVNLGNDPDIGRGIQIFRAQDTSHYFILSALRNTGAPTVNNTLRLLFRDGAGYFELDRSTVDLSDLEADHVLKVALDGSGISCSIDNGHEVSATSTMYQAETLHGFAGFPDGTVDSFSFDDDVLPIITEPLSCTPALTGLRGPQRAVFLATCDLWRNTSTREGLTPMGGWVRQEDPIFTNCIPFQHVEQTVPEHIVDGLFVPATVTHTFRFHSSVQAIHAGDVLRMRVGNYPGTFWVVQEEPAKATWMAKCMEVNVARQVAADSALEAAAA